MYTVMIPCRNEERTIQGLVREVHRHADVVLVADDGSTDATAYEAERGGAVVFPVPRTRPGLAGVYRAGLRRVLGGSGANAVCEMDAGGSHDPAELPRFWRALERGAEVAAGRRFGGSGAIYQGAWQRRILSWGGTLLTNTLHGTAWQDATSGFVAYTREALERLTDAPWECRGHYYQTEMRLRARTLGLRVVEVPITYRNSGTSLNRASIAEALQRVFAR